MKNKVLFILYLFATVGIQAQVGINTSTPAGNSVFHIDAKGNTINGINYSDDVLIDNNGNIGIGVLSPTAKLESQGSATLAPMQITDGKQAKDMLLTSDDAGNASWIPRPFPGGVVYRTKDLITFPFNTYKLVYAIPIPESGNYLISIRWWGKQASVTGTGLSCGTFYVATSNNTANNWAADQVNLKDQGEYCSTHTTGGVNSFSTSLFSTGVKGNYLKLYLRVSAGGNWITGAAAPGASGQNYTWNPSFVVFRV